jgi:hypothetical protein
MMPGPIIGLPPFVIPHASDDIEEGPLPKYRYKVRRVRGKKQVYKVRVPCPVNKEEHEDRVPVGLLVILAIGGLMAAALCFYKVYQKYSLYVEVSSWNKELSSFYKFLEHWNETGSTAAWAAGGIVCGLLTLSLLVMELVLERENAKK